MNDNYHHGNLKEALIEAGIELVENEGLHALTLRKVARLAGVSHNAPYSHFKDKQALIAGIATAGFVRLFDSLNETLSEDTDDPAQQLVEMAWAYVQFAVENPAYFKVTFSGIVENEVNYPEYGAQTRKSFELLVKLVEDCQQSGLLKGDDKDLLAMSIWASIHGFISLHQGNLISGRLLSRFSLRDMLIEHIKMTIPFSQAVDIR